MSSWAKAILQAEETARILSEATVKPQPDSAFMRTNRTLRPVIDLTVVHTDEPLRLEDSIIYKWLTVETVDAPFTFRLKSSDGHLSNPFIADVGFNITQHDFVEILVTNAAGVGIGAILVGWRE